MIKIFDMKHCLYIAMLIWLSALTVTSCLDTEELEARADALDGRIEALEKAVTTANDNAVALSRLLDEKILITGYEAKDHGYILSLSDGTSVNVTYGLTAPSVVPMLGVDRDGNWIMSVDGGETFTEVSKTHSAIPEDGATPEIAVNADDNWVISYDNGETWNEILGENGKPISAKAGKGNATVYTYFKDVTVNADEGNITLKLMADDMEIVVPFIDDFYAKFIGYEKGTSICLEQELVYGLEMSSVKDVIIRAPQGWHSSLKDDILTVTAPATGTEGQYVVSVILVSPDGLLKNVDLEFALKPVKYDQALVKEYRDFIAQNEENILIDYSYAGYAHGEVAPPDVMTLGWKVYDVTDYGAIPNDGKSDREAFLECVKAATGKNYVVMGNNVQITFDSNASSKAIVYFPEGDFILHTKDDDHVVDGKTYSRSILIRSGDIVIKGAGRDKTRIIMADPMQPSNEDLYSSPAMIGLQHYTGPGKSTNVDVTEDAPKGTFSVTVSDASAIKVGDFVFLELVNNATEVVAADLSPYAPLSTMTDIINEGVMVTDIHKVKSKSGNVVTFHEPLMYGVKSSWGWKLKDFSYYNNVGIEDLTFKGYAKSDFKHHGSWEDDGGYKPILMQRLTNAWIRRVNFTDISEAATLSYCANSSVYDILFDGNRGHSSVRSTASSRIFIGATKDITSGPALSGGAYVEGAGHCHGVGVSRTSIGAVLWNNVYGSDSFIEMHGNQPRATLLDCSTGPFKKGNQGGGDQALPNHHSDLTIWNYDSTNTLSGEFSWWKGNWRILPPIIVGLHGSASGVTFPEGSYVVDSARGEKVEPASLYEAQIKNRLGYVPAWLLSLK